MDRLAEMDVFVRVADLGSFTRAAEQLALPKATVSAAVQSLEQRLGTRLFHRTTRRVELTQDGRDCYERCRDLLANADELATAYRVDGASLAGRIRVDLPGGTARRVVIPRLSAFLDAHPALEIELSATDRRVDLVREGFDCVVRVGHLGDSSLVARPLGRYRQANAASPAYLARHGTPRTLDDLARHRLVEFAGTFGTAATGFEYRDGDEYRLHPVPASLTVNSAEAYEAACLAGLGIIQAPVLGLDDHFASGRLVRILDALEAEPMPVAIVYPHRRHQPKRVQVFIAWLAEVLTPHLDP